MRRQSKKEPTCYNSITLAAESNRVALGRAGVVTLLDLCHNHKYLKRRSQEVALEKIAAACEAYVDKQNAYDHDRHQLCRKKVKQKPELFC